MSLRRSESFLGILMLETRFPRPRGDVGVAGSFAMPVRHLVVRGALPRRVVQAEPDAALLAPFVEAARELVAQGAAAITTGCGFLIRFQQALQAELPVPVWTSALLKLPELAAPGVLTVDAQALTPAHLQAAGASDPVPVEGLDPGCSLQRTLLDDLPTLDLQAAERDVVSAACRLVERHPAVTSLVLECTNMPPYAAAVQLATGRPVHHLMTLVAERWSHR